MFHVYVDKEVIHPTFHSQSGTMTIPHHRSNVKKGKITCVVSCRLVSSAALWLVYVGAAAMSRSKGRFSKSVVKIQKRHRTQLSS